MPDRTLNPMLMVALGAASTITDDGHQWIEVITTGEKLKNGPFFFTITRADLDVYAASIETGGGRIPLDYDHSYAEGNGTRAAGWFTGQTRVAEKDGAAVLEAEVAWTPAAVDAIRTGEYRFISPEFTFAEKDTKTGLMTKAREMLAATLTNRPFFKELAPVGAEAGALIWDSTRSWFAIVKQIERALNPMMPVGDDLEWAPLAFCVEDITADLVLIEETATDRYWVANYQVDATGAVTVAASSDWVEAREEWVAATEARSKFNQARRAATKGDDTMSLNTVLAKSLGLADDATEDAITAALAAKDAKIAELTAQAAVTDDLISKATAGAQAAKELHEIKVDTLIKNAVSDGKIPPVAADAYRTMASNDLAGVTALLDALPAKSFDEKGSNDAKPHGDVATAKDAEKFEYGSHAADKDSLELHAKAEAKLAEAGKAPGQYTAEEYQAAVVAVSRA